MADTQAYLEYVPLADTPPANDQFSPEEQRVLDGINRKVASASSIEDIIDFVFDSIHPISPCDRFGLAFIEEQGQRASLRHAKASYEPLILGKGYTEDLSESSLAPLLSQRTIRVIHDLKDYLEAHPDSRSTALLLREGVRSSMTCPLVVDDRAIGFLFRSSRQPGDYDQRQVLLHQAISERLSQAVEKAYRIQQLAALNDAYTEMLSFVTHELKSPVASMVGDATLFDNGYLGDLDQKQQKTVQRIIRKGQYLLNLIGEYLNLARIEGGQLALDDVSEVDLVADVIQPAIDIVSDQVSARNVTVENNVTSPLHVAVDSNLLKIVMVNLLSNAIKYGRESGRICINAEHNDSNCEVTVWNEGPGFTEEQKSRLFKRFSRLKSPELMKEKGTGVGLYTTWRIVQLHHGRIIADSTPGEWASFTFRIPQPIPDA